jgi:putative ABC transport system permease protein
MIRDLSYGIRTLLRTPGFTLIAVFTIALGIAGNTAIFSAIDEQVLRSLLVTHPEQLVQLLPTGAHDSFPIPTFEYLRAHSNTLDGMFASDDGRITVLIDGQADFVWNRFVSGNYDAVMGIKPVLGRGFTSADDKRGGSRVAVIGSGYWKSKFGGLPSVIGSTIFAKNIPLKIVGVYPDMDHWRADVWLPMVLHPELALKDNTTVGIFGRIKSGTVAATTAELSVVYQQALSDAEGKTLTPDKQREIAESRIQIVHIGRGGSRSFSIELQILAVAVGFVLLIACANVANLLLARASARKREIAVRLALGASRSRLVRQLLSEGLLLSVFGGGIGFLLAWWGSNAFGIVVGQRALAVSANSRVLVFTAALSLFVTLLFALAPALQATAFGRKDRPNLSTASTVSDQQSRTRLRDSLLVAQIALSMISLVGAGLLLRTLTKLHSEDLGFARENLLITRIYPTLVGYEGQRETTLYWNLLDRLNAIPGVSSASMSRMQLLSGYWGCRLLGQATSKSANLDASGNSISPRFFETMGIALLLGRDFSYSDNSGSQKVAIISESTARDYFPGGDPIGKELTLNDDSFNERVLVVGVVKDVHTSLRDVQSHHSPRGVYLPFAQAPETMRGQAALEIRTRGNPAGVIIGIRQAVAAVDKAVPLVGMQTQNDVLEQTMGNDRTMAVLTSSFGVLALVLTAVGLYGSIAYSVARRTREIGIRMALGSSREAVVSKLLSEAALLIACGLLLGVLGSFVLTRTISSQLYGVSTYDPQTFATVVALMTTMALAATYFPARRAMCVDPIVALRCE